jgi:integrase
MVDATDRVTWRLTPPFSGSPTYVPWHTGQRAAAELRRFSDIGNRAEAMNVQELQWQLGHADPQTMMRYLHASTQSAAKRAAEILNRKDQPKLAAVK